MKFKTDHKEVNVSNPHKILFPERELAKKDIVEYYLKIAEYLLPFTKDRLIMMQRFPNGIKESGFFQKEIPDYFPRWIKRKTVDKKEGGKVTHIICDSKETLVYLANQGCIALHAWLSTVTSLKHPDKLIFDLDPSGKFQKIREALPDIKNFFDNLGLIVFPMTTGSAGIHLILPIAPDFHFDRAGDILKILVKKLIRMKPDDLTDEQHKENRNGKIYLDIMRNNYAQTSVIPYSIRALAKAPVATPISWEEALSNDIHPQKYTVNNIFRRLGQINDPWKTYHYHDNKKKNAESLKKIN